MAYRAVSIEINQAASEKMRILMNMITSPIDMLEFLLMLIARTSVPSRTAPPLMAKPTPVPKKKPPKTAINSLSLVICGYGKKATQIANAPMANVVFKAKSFPIILFPSKIKTTEDFCVCLHIAWILKFTKFQYIYN